MNPEPQTVSHKDVLDAIITACQKDVEKENETGQLVIEQQLDHESVWWKTHMIASPVFARFAKELKDLEAKASQCKFNMCPERANVMAKQILDMVQAYKKSIDAKSSESRMNRENRQPTLIQVLSNQKVEKVVSLKDDAKRSIKEALIGKEKEEALY